MADEAEIVENNTYATPREPQIEKVPMLLRVTDPSPGTEVSTTFNNKASHYI